MNKTRKAIPQRDVVVDALVKRLDDHGIAYDLVPMGDAMAVNAKHGQHTMTWWVSDTGGAVIRFIDNKRLYPIGISN